MADPYATTRGRLMCSDGPVSLGSDNSGSGAHCKQVLKVSARERFLHWGSMCINPGFSELCSGHALGILVLSGASSSKGLKSQCILGYRR